MRHQTSYRLIFHVVGGTKGYVEHRSRAGRTLNITRENKEGEYITPVSRSYKNVLPKYRRRLAKATKLKMSGDIRVIMRYNNFAILC